MGSNPDLIEEDPIQNEFYDLTYGPNGRPVWPEDDPFGNRWALFGPFEDPPNYDREYSFPALLRRYIGEDWQLIPPAGAALHPYQIPMLESSRLRDIRNISGT